jgi:hypothetical protein
MYFKNNALLYRNMCFNLQRSKNKFVSFVVESYKKKFQENLIFLANSKILNGEQ